MIFIMEIIVLITEIMICIKEIIVIQKRNDSTCSGMLLNSSRGRLDLSIPHLRSCSTWVAIQEVAV